MSLKLDKAVTLVEKFPNTSKSELGRMLYKKNKALYTNSEDARQYIRRASGAQGDDNRKKLKTQAKTTLFPSGKIYNPYDLPEQELESNLPYIIPVTEETVIGLIMDVHMPYQNNEALTAGLDRLKKDKITILYLNGDIIDAYALSTFDKDPGKHDWKYEIDVVKNFLKTLKKQFKGVKIIYKEGNHEERFMRFMMRKAPELLGFEVFRLDVLLGLKELDIDFIPSKQVAEAGDTLICHGHEFGNQMFAPVNPAKGLFTKTKRNAVCGHHHTISEHHERVAGTKKVIRCYTCGHLGKQSPDYRPFNNWEQGVMEIRFTKVDNVFESKVSNLRIVDGKIH